MTENDQIYSVPTSIGMAKMTYASANSLAVQMAAMAIGDGGGALVEPDSTWSGLRGEVYRAQLNQLYQHATNPNWLVAELVLPAEVGGWTIREIGLYDAAGDLMYVGNHAEQYKPVQSQGSDETKTIRMVILVSDVAAVTLKTDPTTVLATVDYVQRELAKLDHKQSVRYATTAAINLSGLAVQAGGDWAAALTAGDRVLVKNQAAASANGIYVAAAGAWPRATDADLSVEVTSGLVVMIEQGATLASTRWQLVTAGAIVLGTTSLTFQNITQGFAPLASPTFTGDPKAPTPAQFDNDTSVATTAFVQRALGNLRGVDGYTATADIVLTPADVGKLIQFGGVSQTFNVTLPDPGAVPLGSTLTFRGAQAGGTCTIKAPGSLLINLTHQGASASSYALSSPELLTLVAVTTAGWVVLSSAGTPNYTPDQFDSDQSLATTAFVARALGNLRPNSSAAIVADTTLLEADAGKWWEIQIEGVTVTLPAWVAGRGGSCMHFKVQRDATIKAADGEVIYGLAATSALQTLSVKRGEVLTLLHHGVGGWHLVADGFGAESFKSSLALPGYQKLPGGFILQFGSVTATAAGVALTLPQTFPNACLIAGAFDVVTPGTTLAAANLDGMASVSGKSTNSITVHANGAADWFAIGW